MFIYSIADVMNFIFLNVSGPDEDKTTRITTSSTTIPNKIAGNKHNTSLYGNFVLVLIFYSRHISLNCTVM